MAEAVHTQVGGRVIFGAALAYVAAACWLTGCDSAQGSADPAGGTATQQQQKGSTSGTTAKQPPPPESIDRLAPEQVVALLLKRCHGTLQGAAKMANCVIKLGLTADDENPELILLGSNDCMRVQRRDGTRETMIGERAWRIARVANQFEVTPIEGADLEALARFQKLLRSTLLEPLYDWAKVTRQGPTVFAVTTKRGATWRLEVRQIKLADGAAQWFPFTLTGPPGKITFETLLHIGITNLPRQVVLDDFGRRWFILQTHALVYDPSVFTNPNLDTKPSRTTVIVAGFTNDPKIGDCALRTIKSKVALVSPDPGEWQPRIEALLENGDRLHEQGQQAADLDFLFDKDGERWIGQPFTMADPERGGRPFVKKKGQRILHLPAHRAVLVYPPNGSLESCEKAARKLLDAFVAENELTAAGPLRIIPWVEIESKMLTPREQKHLRIGFELPVK